MPQGDHGMETRQDQDDGAARLMEFRDGTGGSLHGRRNSGQRKAEEETGTPSREAAYQPVIGRPIMKRYSTACPTSPRD